MKKDIIDRLYKAGKKKRPFKPSDKAKAAAKTAMEKRVSKADGKKKKKKKGNRPDLDLNKLAQGSKCFAAPKKVKKAIEPWQLDLLKVDLKG